MPSLVGDLRPGTCRNLFSAQIRDDRKKVDHRWLSLFERQPWQKEPIYTGPGEPPKMLHPPKPGPEPAIPSWWFNNSAAYLNNRMWKGGQRNLRSPTPQGDENRMWGRVVRAPRSRAGSRASSRAGSRAGHTYPPRAASTMQGSPFTPEDRDGTAKLAIVTPSTRKLSKPMLESRLPTYGGDSGQAAKS